MTILNSQRIIRGVKPIRIKPTFNDGSFRKELPIGEHNFPLTKYTTYKICGYKKDPLTGMKKPFWLTRKFPTGRPINAKMCGLDGFFTIKPINQVI